MLICYFRESILYLISKHLVSDFSTVWLFIKIRPRHANFCLEPLLWVEGSTWSVGRHWFRLAEGRSVWDTCEGNYFGSALNVSDPCQGHTNGVALGERPTGFTSLLGSEWWANLAKQVTTPIHSTPGPLNAWATVYNVDDVQLAVVTCRQRRECRGWLVCTTEDDTRSVCSTWPQQNEQLAGCDP